MPDSLGNKLLSARFLERIEDDLDSSKVGLPFQKVFVQDTAEYGRLVEEFRSALPELLTAHRMQVLKGQAPELEGELLAALDMALDSEGMPFSGLSSLPQDVYTAKLRAALPILIRAYRMEAGLPLRMR